MSCSSDQVLGDSGILRQGQMEISSSYRYFQSFRHFRGDHEESNRVMDATNVINTSHGVDMGLRYGLTGRTGLALNIPFVYYDRSSLYEHYGNRLTSNPTQARFHTGASGLGDMRLTANRWVWNPATTRKGNLSLGLGLKAPTGRSRAEDTFHKRAEDGSDSLIVKAVDQSIQPGDGGWGINLEAQGFRSLGRSVLTFNAFYLVNPKGVNGVPHSVADQYAARLGLSFALMPEKGLSAGLFTRLEGVPSSDLIGSSDGRRRPGYILSIEPNVSYSKKGLNLALNVPIALYRNRTQSYSDKQRTQQTGVYTIGDAAFADYLVNIVVSTQFGKTHSMIPSHE